MSVSEHDIKENISSSDNSEHQQIVILGSGFAGIEVLKNLQKKFQNDKNIDVILVSRDNFLLFTPMLPEVASGTIDTRHIVTPVRTFCKRAKFYQAEIKSIDLDNKQVVIEHAIGKQFAPADWHNHTIVYDYLVIALGSETNFFGMSDLEKNSFTMKSIDDAIILRNHIIDVLEQASIEQDKDKDLTKSLLTFVVAGGGFSGIETVGALNDFVRETVREFYKNIYMTEIKIILVTAEDKILAEVDEELGKFALQKLKENGVEFMMNALVNGATINSTRLDNGSVIPCHTIIWTAGVTPNKLISTLPCDHNNESGRIISNGYLEVPGYNGVYALGDCAYITNPKTGKPYPPTAQYAIRQGKVAAKNIISTIKTKQEEDRSNSKKRRREGKEEEKKKFDYKAKGIMADIGNRNGVAIMFGFKLQGFKAWWLWRMFYLANLPTTKKKLKVMIDWTMDLLFKPDVAMIKRFVKEKREGETEE